MLHARENVDGECRSGEQDWIAREQRLIWARERASGVANIETNYMDQPNVAEQVDLGPSLANTVAVLNSKAREKSVAVTLNMDAELPKVRGFAGELNLVWGNLIENALDAVANGGQVQVLANRENQSVVVRILDNGPGIPLEVRDSIFDPFFTTKPMGQGTGLGLDIARRLVRHNDGAIDFESQPGRTEFRVTLPIAEIDPAYSLPGPCRGFPSCT